MLRLLPGLCRLTRPALAAALAARDPLCPLLAYGEAGDLGGLVTPGGGAP